MQLSHQPLLRLLVQINYLNVQYNVATDNKDYFRFHGLQFRNEIFIEKPEINTETIRAFIGKLQFLKYHFALPPGHSAL